MIEDYDHKKVEKKWREKWENAKLFQDTSDKVTGKGKKYILFAFPYPSGEGLHVGHMEPYTALDILARYYRMTGEEVFFPVGWDSFGLPAENYAVKTGIHPRVTTIKAIANFTEQLRKNGISKDWSSEISTSNPDYYKWTQWLFLEFYKAGLAYKGKANVNWCPSCQTVLANEQVVNGQCERCGSDVIQKEMEQWFFKITDYKDQLIKDLDQVDWPSYTKLAQVNWIGRKEGINITYKIDGLDKTITCFTTRPDTNFGATFIVVAPDSKFAKENIDLFPNKSEAEKYIEKSLKKTELERVQDGRSKTGVFTGLYAVNQLNDKKLPIYIADFALASVGTGAVVGVPGHDKRDFEFAKEFGLEIVRVVVSDDGDTSKIERIDQIQEENGTMVNSDFLNGLDIHEATVKMMDYLDEKGWGKRVVSYKLRDWLISRQRYWGAPIPIVYDPEGQPHAVKEEHLPWLLPDDVDFNPHGESPLKSSQEFKERVERLYGKGWTPEYDTMDTFVDSSWYYLRYVDAKNDSEFANKEKIEKLLPVDFYMIGPEHTVLHLLYSRFFTKFLRDRGYLSFDEPFMKMRHQGFILGPNNAKMSKSKGNIIVPDEVIDQYGSDTLRTYEMFMGPIDADKPWDTNGVVGVRKFLARIYRLSTANNFAETSSVELASKLNKTINKVGSDIENLKFNTAIASMMEFVNLWEKDKNGLSREDTLKFVKILAPFAPFISDEIYEAVAGTSSGSLEKVNENVSKNSSSGTEEFNTIHVQSWPEYNKSLAKEETTTIVIQVNGKVRGMLENVSVNASEDEIKQMAVENASKYLANVEIKKVVYVPQKLMSFVV